MASLKGSDFVLNSIGMHYKCHKINLNCGKSRIDSPRWLKNKEATISPKINYNKSFQYTITVTLNHENIQKEP